MTSSEGLQSHYQFAPHHRHRATVLMSVFLDSGLALVRVFFAILLLFSSVMGF